MPVETFQEKCRRVMRLKHLSFRTEETYLPVIRRFIEFHGGRTPPRDRSLAAGLLRLLDLRPGVSEGDGSVEDGLLRRGVGVDAEVAEPLELVPRARRRVGHAGLHQAHYHP